MKLHLLPPLALGALLLAGLGLHSFSHPSSAAAEPAPPSTATDARRTQPGGSHRPSVLLEPAEELRGGDDPAAEIVPPPPALPDRVAVDTKRGERDISGRLVLPAGAPADPSLEVVALGNAHTADEGWGDRSWDRRATLARASVDAEGRFHLELSGHATPERVFVDVDGSYLFLHEPVELSSDPSELVLEPELGGLIVGRLVLPSGTTEVPPLAKVGGFGMHYSGAGSSREVDLESELSFELRAVEPDMNYRMWANSDIYPGAVLPDEILVEAGGRVAIEIPLTRGARVRGRVVDVDGQPLHDVEVSGNTGGSNTLRPGAGETRTDGDGRFELRGLTAEPQALSALADDYLQAETEELPLTDGGVIEDLEIVLERGLELAGVVRWPDAIPAVDARVTVVPIEVLMGGWRLFERARSAEGTARTNADGAFRVGGLTEGVWGIHVECPARDGSDDLWNARLAAVQGGSEDLILTLAAPQSLTALVRDDAGAPVRDLLVRARRLEWPAWMEGSSSLVERTFEDTPGRFDLGGLDDGEWTLAVQADGHLASEERTLTVPSPQLEPFVLMRTGALAGTVTDPSGRPVANAEVIADAHTPEGRSSVTLTDAAGRFTFDSVGPGALSLEARSDDWAPSGAHRLELEPGESLEGRALALTRGGTLTGVVYDRDGAPDADRTIVLQSEHGDFYEALSDVAGEFALEHLAPNRYQVIATPETEVWGTDSEELDMGEVFAEMRMTMATVVDGETVEVVLGAPPTAPVVVHGRVTHAGEPMARASVMVMAESGSTLASMRIDTADDEGRFELTLDEPGDYTFVTLASDTFEAEIDFPVTVPAVERHRVDLELPAGSIAGHLVGPDGGVPADALLWFRRQDGSSELSVLMRQSAVGVEEDGTFLIETLHPGLYALTATAGDLALTTVHDIEVREGRATEGVELSLSASGRLSGSVVDANGDPAGHATVLVRDGAGRPLYRLDTVTDEWGRFSMRNLPVGDVLVSARTREQISVEKPARVSAAEEATVELGLAPGAILRIALVDEEGVALRGSIRVESEAGCEYTQSASRDELERLLMEGLSPGGRCVGPVPVGRYRVSARAGDGRSASATLTLEPGERDVTLRLE